MATADEQIEERLVELETKASFTDVNHEQLSEVVYQQQILIDALQKQVASLSQQIKTAAASGAKDGEWRPEDEIPPHY